MKKILALALTLLMLVSVPFSAAFAESYTSSGWEVTFNGTQINSNFKSSTINTEVSKIEPGDSITVTISLKNTYEGTTDWYMSNEVLKSLEESKSTASGGAYDYDLSYKGPGETRTFFSSSGVGGDNGDIKTATGNLKDYFFVGSLKSGETGTVTLKVALDGETDGNSYQDSMAQFKMVFAVEKTKEDGTRKEYSPKTGEVLHMVLWCVVFLASLAVIIAIVKAKKKARKENEKV